MNILRKSMCCVILLILLHGGCFASFVSDSYGIYPICVSIYNSTDGEPVKGAVASITGTNLQMIAENPADDLHRYAKIAIQPQFTNGLGHVAAYFHSRKSSLTIDGITTHEIGIDGILIVEAKGFKKKLINLKDYYKASRVSYRSGLCLACFVELEPISSGEK